MKRILFILANIIYLFHGAHAAAPHSFLPPDINLSMIYKSVTPQAPLQDNAGNHWRVYSTLTLDQKLVKDFGHITLTPLNLRPVVIDCQTAVDFFQGCTDQINFESINTVQIGLKFMYPLAIQALNSADSLTLQCAYLIRSIPQPDASKYRTIPNISELEAAFMIENNRLLEAQASWYKQIRATFMTKQLLPTCVLLVCVYPIILLLRALFLPTGLFATP